MNKIIQGKFREPQGSDPETATCGKCEDKHVTTRYLANRYPRDECSLCVYEKRLEDLYKEAERTQARILKTLENMKETVERRKAGLKEYAAL